MRSENGTNPPIAARDYNQGLGDTAAKQVQRPVLEFIDETDKNIDGIWGFIKSKVKQVVSSAVKLVTEPIAMVTETAGQIVSGIAQGINYASKAITTPISFASNAVKHVADSVSVAVSSTLLGTIKTVQTLSIPSRLVRAKDEFVSGKIDGVSKKITETSDGIAAKIRGLVPEAA